MKCVRFGWILSLGVLTAVADAPKVPELKMVRTPGHQIVITPPREHHFNLKAPFQLTSNQKKVNWSRTSPAAMVSEVLKPADTRLEISAFICDEANTYCVRKVLSRHWEELETEAIPSVVPAVTAPKSKTRAISVPRFTHLYTDPNLGLKDSKLRHRPIFWDFYGIWCPPCNLMDETVLNQADVLSTMKSFTVIRVDADQPSGFSWKRKYRVSGYPTYILTTSEGDEIRRIVGTRTAPELLSILVGVAKAPNDSLAKKSARASTDSDAASQLAESYFEQKRYEEARRVLEPHAHTALWDRVVLALHPNWDAEREALLRASWLRDPMGLAALTSLDELVEKEVFKSDADRSRVVSRLRALNPIVGEDWVDLLWARVDLYKKLNLPAAEIQGAQSELVTLLERRIAERRRPLEQDRGDYLQLVHLWQETGKIDKAIAILAKFQKAFPREFTFYYTEARLRMKQNDWAGAEPKARMSYRYSYGDNRIRSVKLIAEIQTARGNRAAALETLKKAALEFAPLRRQVEIAGGDAPGVRTLKYLGELDALKNKLNPQP